MGEEEDNAPLVQLQETARLAAYDFVSRANDTSMRRRGGGHRREFLLSQNSNIKPKQESAGLDASDEEMFSEISPEHIDHECKSLGEKWEQFRFNQQHYGRGGRGFNPG